MVLNQNYQIIYTLQSQETGILQKVKKGSSISLKENLCVLFNTAIFKTTIEFKFNLGEVNCNRSFLV